MMAIMLQWTTLTASRTMPRTTPGAGAHDAKPRPSRDDVGDREHRRRFTARRRARSTSSRCRRGPSAARLRDHGRKVSPCSTSIWCCCFRWRKDHSAGLRLSLWRPTANASFPTRPSHATAACVRATIFICSTKWPPILGTGANAQQNQNAGRDQRGQGSGRRGGSAVASAAACRPQRKIYRRCRLRQTAGAAGRSFHEEGR